MPKSTSPAIRAAAIEALESRRLLSGALYENDFSSAASVGAADGITASWSHSTLSTAPNGEKFLGEFGKNNVGLTLSDLPAHGRVTVSFDLYVAKSWDGTSTYGGYGPDRWGFSLDGASQLDATFSNKFPHYNIPVSQPQSFVSQTTVGGSNDAGTGAYATGSLGYSFQNRQDMDSVYRFSYTLDHASPTLQLLFRGNPNQDKADESWGIDNVKVEDATPRVTLENIQNGYEEGRQPYGFTLRLSDPLATPVSVDVRHVMNGVQRQGAYRGDFGLTAGVYTFEPGQQTISVKGFVADDRFDEPDDTVDLWIESVSGAEIGTPSSGTAVIYDNDDSGGGGGGGGGTGDPIPPIPPIWPPLPPGTPPPQGDWIDLELGAWWDDNGDTWADEDGDGTNDPTPDFGSAGGDGLSKGHFLRLNSDFDEIDPANPLEPGDEPLRDLESDGIVPSDGEVVPLSFGFGSDQSLEGASWTLEWDEEKVRIWTPVFDEETGELIEYQAQCSGWTQTIGGDSPYSYWWWGNGVGAWVEAVGESTELDDTVFTATLTPAGRDPVADIVKSTMVDVDLVAHRTGSNFGEPIADTLQDWGDPKRFVVLVNDDFEEPRPDDSIVEDWRDLYDDRAAVPGSDGEPIDDDLVKITLKQLPSYLQEGTMSLVLSAAEPVRLFKADGTLFYEYQNPANEPLSFDVASPTGYLSGTSEGELTLWVEALATSASWKNLSLSWQYSPTSGGVVADDTVTMRLARWSVTGINGQRIVRPQPLWMDALLAAAEHGPYTEQLDGSEGWSESFFKNNFAGLSLDMIERVETTSDTYTSDSFEDELDGTPTDEAFVLPAVSSTRFAVAYNSDMYLDQDDGTFTSTQENLIRDNLRLNVVHNQVPTTTLTTSDDRFSTPRRKKNPLEILDLNNDVFAVGGIVTGRARSMLDDWQQFDIKIYLHKPNGTIVSVGNLGPPFEDGLADQAFDFVLDQPGIYKLFATTQFNDEYEPGSSPSITIRADNDLAGSPWRKAAWTLLRLNGVGSVPTEPITRARKISELYSTMYNTAPYIRWSGAAAFASYGVGDAIANASTGHIAAAAGELLGIQRLPMLGNSKAARATFRKFQDLLADGNIGIYEDLYPAFLAYTSEPAGNLNAVVALNLPQDLQAAFETLHTGRLENDDGKIDLATRMILVHEQQVFLEQSVFGGPNEQYWQDFSRDYGSYITAKVPNVRPFQQVFPNANLGDENARIAWFDVEIFPKFKAWAAANNYHIASNKLLNGEYR